MEQDELYAEWKRLVNMTPSELERFMQSEEGRRAGLSASEAKAQGIGRGRDSARAILRMKSKPKSEWTSTDWDWAKRQVSFIKRMRGASGKLEDAQGRPTRKLLALKIWGHDPRKMKSNRRIQLDLDSADELAAGVLYNITERCQAWLEAAMVAGNLSDAVAAAQEIPLGAFPEVIFQVGLENVSKDVFGVQAVHEPGPEHMYVHAQTGLVPPPPRPGRKTRRAPYKPGEPRHWGLTVILNSNYSIGTYAYPEPPIQLEIASAVVHELTHAADPVVRAETPREMKAPESDGTREAYQKYLNHPQEVKAFGQQVIWEALFILPAMEEGYPQEERFRRAVLGSPTFNNAVAYMDERNIKRIIRDAYQEFDKRGLV
jgi:hypothetical protein